MKLRRGKQGKLLKDTAVQCYILKDRWFGDVSQSTTIARLATTTREEAKLSTIYMEQIYTIRAITG